MAGGSGSVGGGEHQLRQAIQRVVVGLAAAIEAIDQRRDDGALQIAVQGLRDERLDQSNGQARIALRAVGVDIRKHGRRQRPWIVAELRAAAGVVAAHVQPRLAQIVKPGVDVAEQTLRHTNRVEQHTRGLIRELVQVAVRPLRSIRHPIDEVLAAAVVRHRHQLADVARRLGAVEARQLIAPGRLQMCHTGGSLGQRDLQAALAVEPFFDGAAQP